MTYGIPYKNPLDTCDYVGQPFNDFHKLIELKKVGLEWNHGLLHVHGSYEL
jgi:hypothetical protein